MTFEPLRLAELRMDIARRLRPVCPTMPAEEFDRLVRRIAEIEYKYEQIEMASKPRGPH